MDDYEEIEGIIRDYVRNTGMIEEYNSKLIEENSNGERPDFGENQEWLPYYQLPSMAVIALGLVKVFGYSPETVKYVLSEVLPNRRVVKVAYLRVKNEVLYTAGSQTVRGFVMKSVPDVEANDDHEKLVVDFELCMIMPLKKWLEFYS